ncbi:MAG: hypothetical protein ABWY08_16445, partial [Comamonas sp.]
GVRNLNDDLSATAEADRKARLAVALADARKQLFGGLEMLVQLNAIQSSPERESLCASAFKRQAMLETLGEQPQQAALALEAMERHYCNAEKTARDKAHPEWYYPALNRLAAQLVRQLAAGATVPVPVDATGIRCCIEEKVHADPDFYSVVAGIELDFYLALAAGTLAAEEARLVAQFDDLYRQVQAPRWWNSVRDQIDFVGSQCDGRLSDADQQACERLRARLEKMAPRSRTPEPERSLGRYPAFV